MPANQKAFVLLRVSAGHTKDVAEKLLKFTEVKEVHTIAGEWDLLAVIEAKREVVSPTDEVVLQVVIDKIDKVAHVERSNTMIPTFSRVKA
jgi:DNA-binding Lrp family transcriptional regulator